MMTVSLLRSGFLVHRSSSSRSILRPFASSWNWNDPKKSATTTASGESFAPLSVDAQIQKQVLDKCAALHSSIMPLNEKLRGPLAKNSNQGTALPFVFLVGNHSSGKSSFVNYIMGRPVQTCGVAPTDDCFTVVAPGPEDTDQDGPALIGDPDMGFQNLRQFGPTLIHHTQLKVRNGIANTNFMLVDSPGMIDSPHSESMDRGYDFQGVVRWFAERADVVLLFFDPDKPGTTGETLNILLHSLAGMDHKLLIVLNKADQFKKIHDFARAYGSLCWNLSKVIPRKDLPRIFTMCLPQAAHSVGESSIEANTTTTNNNPGGLADLHQTRHDVVAEVMKAPKRRIDNMVTHLHDATHLLWMHATLLDDVKRRYRKRMWEHKINEVSLLSAMSGLAGLSWYMELPMQATGAVVAAAVVSVGGLVWYNASKLKEVEGTLTTPEDLAVSFQRCYAREVSDADEFTASVWQRIREPLRLSLLQHGVDALPSVTSADIAALVKIVDVDIPELRRVASPTHFGSGKDE